MRRRLRRGVRWLRGIRLLDALRHEVSAEIFWVVAVRVSSFARDASGADEFCQGLLHGEHSVGAACFDVGAELVVVAAADEVARCGGCNENLHGWITTGAGCGGQELLRDDGEEREGELLPNLRLVAGGEGIEDARDGLCGVVGMEGREYEVTGFGGG